MASAATILDGAASGGLANRPARHVFSGELKAGSAQHRRTGHFVGIELRQSVLGRALDAMAEAAFFMSDGRLHYANRAGQMLLDEGDPLRLQHGRVEPSRAVQQARFAEMVDATDRRGEIGALSLRGDSGGRLNVTTVRAHASGGVIMLGARVGRGEGRIVAQLAKAFGLTGAEADIARAIGDGAAPAAIAKARGASLSTVQSQLKTVASKLGCRRQSEIAAIVQAMPRLLGC